jgi:hypothetical protein
MQRDWFILPKEQVCILGATCASDVSKNAVVNYDQHWVHRELQLDRNMDTILLTYFKIPVQSNYSIYMYAEDLPKHSLTIEEEDHIRYSDLFKAI